MQSRLIVLIVLLVALVTAIVIAAVGGGDDEGSGSISTDLSAKPEVPVPEGDPPAELEINDVVVGDGPEAAEGDSVTVQYVGVNYSNGQQFDASWDSGQPFDFALGAGSVIPGWDEGVVGMKVGGRRELVIPPDLGYGAQGQPPDIPPTRLWSSSSTSSTSSRAGRRRPVTGRDRAAQTPELHLRRARVRVPAASVARTRNLCLPSRTLYLRGELHGFHFFRVELALEGRAVLVGLERELALLWWFSSPAAWLASFPERPCGFAGGHPAEAGWRRHLAATVAEASAAEVAASCGGAVRRNAVEAIRVAGLARIGVASGRRLPAPEAHGPPSTDT